MKPRKKLRGYSQEFKSMFPLDP